MVTNEKLVDVLNDLIQINNDRTTGYEKAMEEIENIDVDLKSIFSKMANDSRSYKAALANEVTNLGGEVAEGRTVSGSIYQAWMSVKATFSAKDRQAALESCEFGEDAAQKAYKEALESDADMTTEVRQLIANQKDELKSAHDTIKKLRDVHKAVNA